LQVHIGGNVPQVVYIGTMSIRMSIYLSETQRKRLQIVSDKTGAPVAEIIRRFVDAGLKKGK
jgi:predicted DNA-binding protein